METNHYLDRQQKPTDLHVQGTEMKNIVVKKHSLIDWRNHPDSSMNSIYFYKTRKETDQKVLKAKFLNVFTASNPDLTSPICHPVEVTNSKHAKMQSLMFILKLLCIKTF